MIDRDGKQTSSCMDSSIIPHEKKNCVLIDICRLKHLSQKSGFKMMLSFAGQKRCFQVSLESHVCQPSQSGQRSRQELRQRHWTSSWRFQSGFTFTLQMGMKELRNSCMNSIILSYIYLPCWIRDIGVEVYKSLGSFQGRMRGLRLSSETSSRFSFFAEIRWSNSTKFQ